MADKFVVGRVADIPVGERLIVEVNGRSIGIFNVNGEFYGVVNRCPHMGAEMCRGHLAPYLGSSGPGEYDFDTSRQFLMCPWHGWEFDIKTGQSYLDPNSTRIRTYQVEVEDGKLLASAVEEGTVARERAAASGPTADPFVHGRVEGPYKAETVDVSVEDDYVVVNLRPPRPNRPARPPKPTTDPAPTGAA
jgi:3-phenylpropionate/trans-cinnamate dioxygenase ferredoxin subunit